VAFSGSPTSVAAGDLTSNGKLDLVVTDFDAGRISVLLRQGNGQFAKPVDYPVGKQPSFVLVGDVNGDGKLDVVVCNEADGTISVLFGNGDGTLQSPATYKVPADPLYVVMGDFNGDGKPDLAVAGGASNTIAVLVNDGTGKFSQSIPYNIGRSPRSLAVADFEGDGHTDLASANADGTVSILLGRGDGSFRAISSVSVASVPLSSVVAGDFNGDGKPDLAVTQAGTKLLTVLLGRGNGTFQLGASYAVGSNPAFVIAADINNDNILDLLTANQSGNTFSVLLGNGDGTFKPSMDFVAGNSPRALATGDFNGDGRLDLAIVNFADRTISVPLGNGDGTFQAARAYRVDLDRKSVAAGDLDGDGKPDLVVTNFCGTDTTCSGNGTVSVLLDVGDGTYKLAASYPLGAGPLSVALADLNGDKKLDLIAVNRGDKSVSVLLGNGDGTFQSGLTYPAGTSPMALAIGDFNKDGKLDLAIAGDCGTSTCSQPGEVSVLVGVGDGTFQAAATYPAGYSPTAVAVGDLNGDGNLDLVIANACGRDSSCQDIGTATVLLGDGKGAFKSTADVPLGKSPSSLALGHLNGDGALALVAAYRAGNKVGVLLGNGDGTFKPPVTYPVGAAPSAVVVADFNGDGKRDVAVANLKDSKVSVLFGNGDGTLQTAVHYPVGAGPESLVAIDSKKHGHADLVSANGNGGLSPKGSDVTVLRNLASDTGTAISTTALSRTNGSGPVTYGQEVDILATVTGDGSSGTPTGTVAFTVNGNSFDTNCDSVPLTRVDDNTATAPCNTTLLPAGNPTTVTGTYSGDSTYAPSSGTLTQVVNKADVVFSNFTSSPNPSQYLQPVTLSVTVTGAFGGVPTGSVSFFDNGTQLCSGNLDGNGNAHCSTTALSVGTHSNVTATYNGDSNFNPGTSPPVVPAPVVNKANAVFSNFTSSPNPSRFHQSVTFSVTVMGMFGGVPQGSSVTFKDNGSLIGGNCTRATINPVTGVATCNTTTLTRGTHSNITATYNGEDGNFNPGTSSPLTPPQVVGQAGVVFSNFTSSPNPSQYLQSVTLSVTVMGESGGVPQGSTVTFKDNGNAIGGPCTLAMIDPVSGVATCSTTALTVGTHSNITATYNGEDGNFAPGTSSPLAPPQVVTKANTTTAITSIVPDPSQGSSYLQTVTFNVLVTGDFGGTPTGTVDVQDVSSGSPVLVCTVTFGSRSKSIPGKRQAPNDGSAGSCQSSSLTVGTHSIQATYNGDGNFNMSTTPPPPISYRVSKAGTTTAITSIVPDPSQGSSYLQTVTFNVLVTGDFGGTPTGTVDVQDVSSGSPVLVCTVTFGSRSKSIPSKRQPSDGGSAGSCQSASLRVGTHSIQATYNGDGNFNMSTTPPPPISYPVSKASTTTAVPSSSLNPSVSTQQVTFTTTVTGAYGGTPSGSVTFTDVTDPGNPIAICTASLNNGTSMCSSAALMSGVRSITATYSGDGNFLTSTSLPLTQIVEDFSLAISASPPVSGGTVVTQGFNNGNQPIGSQTITVSTESLFQFSGNVALSSPCTIMPPTNALTCSVSPTTIPVPSGTPTGAVTLTASGSAPLGPYTATVMAHDVSHLGSTLTHSVTLPFAVINYTSTINVAPDQPGVTAVSFVGSAAVTVTFTCSTIAGPNGMQPFLGNTYNVGCQLVPATAVLSTDPSNPTSVTATITSSSRQSARLATPTRILATLWLGIPAIVLVGSLRLGKISRKKILQLLGMLLIVVGLLQGIGCGGGFARPASSTPSGSYQVLIVGTDAAGTVQTSAVIPFNVID
jgi:hypothetical protein